MAGTSFCIVDQEAPKAALLGYRLKMRPDEWISNQLATDQGVSSPLIFSELVWTYVKQKGEEFKGVVRDTRSTGTRGRYRTCLVKRAVVTFLAIDAQTSAERGFGSLRDVPALSGLVDDLVTAQS